jgi:hypothetical protein
MDIGRCCNNQYLNNFMNYCAIFIFKLGSGENRGRSGNIQHRYTGKRQHEARGIYLQRNLKLKETESRSTCAAGKKVMHMRKRWLWVCIYIDESM